MATDETSSITTTSQVSTNETGPPLPAGMTEASSATTSPSSTPAEGSKEGDKGTFVNPPAGIGVDGEVEIWEGRYALKNFLGRATVRLLLTLGWIALAVYTWSYGHTRLVPLTIGLAGVLVILWLALLWRIVQARIGHKYRLTSRRLFVATGLMRRRSDMMELIRVKDVYIRETGWERLLRLGSVVVVSTDSDMPMFYLTGVDDPKRIMDLVWHHARTERERRSVMVDQV